MPAGIAGSAGTVAGVAAAGGASAQPEDTVGTCHALSRGLSAVVYSCGGFASLRLDATPERVDLTVSKDGSGIISESYELEYGTDTVEMHADALNEGDRVLLVDDLLATGGAMSAAVKLVEKTGATVAKIAFVVELEFLKGRDKLEGYDVVSFVKR